MAEKTAVRRVCPTCHLAIEEGQAWISHKGKTYHLNCAPSPESAGDNDQIRRGPFHNM